jgi:hypothetical protein
METDINLTSKPPDNNLVWAIFSTILCCWPLGIVSIIKSTKVNSLWTQGDFAGAQKSADDAKKWAIYSAIAAAVFWVLYIVLSVVLGFAINGF